MATSKRSTGKCAATVATGRCSNRAAACRCSVRCFVGKVARCWACLSRPMVENRPGDTVLAGGGVAARPARGGSPATRGLAVNFAAFELARAAAGKGLASLDRSIIAFDLATRACREHFVRLDSNCPVCGPARDEQAGSCARQAAARPGVEARVGPGRRRLAFRPGRRGDAGPGALCEPADRNHRRSRRLLAGRRPAGLPGAADQAPAGRPAAQPAARASRAAPPARE